MGTDGRERAMSTMLDSLRNITAQSREGDKSDKGDKSVQTPGLMSLRSLSAQPERQQSTERTLDASDFRDRYEERAAIVQFDGGGDRARAEARAWNEVVAIWTAGMGRRRLTAAARAAESRW
jgi:hypothetical protein